MRYRMDRMLSLLIFVAALNCKVGNASYLSWIWPSKTDDTTVLVADGVPLVSIPYESMTEDEKFLQEGAKFTDIQVSSPLETCQHKVIMRIKTSCSDMTEEELAKLGVNLLNCQSAIEGRKTFPCTEEMSLKQCTTDMDADMWNAYHLMSNRARAVCYATRSVQFRALTELTVNKLMKSAHSQIEALSSLKESQDRLEEQTVEALSSLSTGNKALLEQQQYLKDAQITAHNLVTTNLRELYDEKALIRSGHTQIATMMEDVKSKIGKAHNDLQQQNIERGQNHQEILEDLNNIQEQVQSIWEKIESSTENILKRHAETVVQYEQTSQKLAQIDDAIQHIWNLTDKMRVEVDTKLGWITDYIDGTGEHIHKVYDTVLHIVYILVAMVIAAFLQAPNWTRAAIVGIVPMNLGLYLKHGAEASLNFTSITILIMLITGMYYLMLTIQLAFGPSRPTQKIITDPVYQNGHLNGEAHGHMSSSVAFMSTERLHTRLAKKLRGICSLFVSQINQCAEKISTLLQSATFWDQSSNVREELSCSYQSLKKKHDDVVDRYDREFPNISNDATNCYSYDAHVSYRDGESNNINDLVDAYELKRRLHRVNTSQSRSATPSSFVSPSTTCMGITRNGRRCRLTPSHGNNYCYRHITGTSVVSDHHH